MIEKTVQKPKAHRACTKAGKRTDKIKCWILIAKSFRFTFISQSSQDKSYRQFSTNRASTKRAITVQNKFCESSIFFSSPKWGLTLPTFHLSQTSKKKKLWVRPFFTIWSTTMLNMLKSKQIKEIRKHSSKCVLYLFIMLSIATNEL